MTTTDYIAHPFPLITVPTYYHDIPPAFVRAWKDHVIAGLDETDISILSNRQACESWSLLNYNWERIRLQIYGHRWKLHLYGHNGIDLWAIPESWTWCPEADDYIPPQVTGQLHRYHLPLRWGPALLQGDRTGFATEDDSVTLDAFIKAEGLTGWACTDVWGKEFSRYHDAVDYGAEPCITGIFTFVRK
jgi:hypothetical protein